MNKRELRRFRKAAGRAFNRAYRRDMISKAERRTLLVKLLDDEQVEDMAAVCAAQAVKSGVLSADKVKAGDIKWVGIGENIDWEQCFEFFLKILPMFL